MQKPKKLKTVMIAAGCIFLLVFFALFGLYLDQKEKDQTVSTGTAFIMDTFVDQKLVGRDSADAVIAVNKALGQFEDRMSAYRTESQISRINKMAGIDFVQVDEETFELLVLAKEYCLSSQGLFDITIGPLVDLWDINGTDPTVPDEQSIRNAMDLIDINDLLLDPENGSVMLKRKGQKLNLGGMAKGAAGAMALESAQEYGIHSVYISVGGNIFTIGGKADGSAYRFGIRDPRGSASDYIGIVDLRDTTMATSGDYERYYEKDGIRYHHILDPLTGYPGQSDLISVSIICDDGARADYLSTLLFLAGREEAMKYAQDESFDFVLVDRDQNVWLSDGAKEIFTPNEKAVDYHFVNLS